MTIWQAIKGKLASDTAITSVSSTRIYPVRAPQIESPLLPIIVGRQIGRVREGAANGPSIMYRDSYEIAAMATTYDAAHALGELIYASLDGFKDVSGAAHSGLKIKLCRSVGLRDEADIELGILAAITTIEISYQ
jgi:hypothetical protein